MPKLFDDLRARLILAGIAPRHVRRYLAELRDHLADLRAETDTEAAALARLGTLEDLAEPMLARPELRSWTARAPWATLVLAPPLGLVAIVVVSVFLMIGTSKLLPWLADPMWTPASWVQTSVTVFTTFEIYILPIFIGWGISVLAIRRRLLVLWPIIGMAVMALVAAGAEFHVIAKSGFHGEIRAGFGTESSDFLLRSLINFVLTAGPYMVLRTRFQPAAV